MKITFAILPYIELEKDFEIFDLKFERYDKSRHENIGQIVDIFYDNTGERITYPTIVLLNESKLNIKEFNTRLRKITSAMSYIFLIEDRRNVAYWRDSFIFEIFEKIKEKNNDIASRTQNGYREIFELSKRREYCPWYISPIKIKDAELHKSVGLINSILSDELISRSIEWYSKSRLFACSDDVQMNLLFRCISFETLFDLGKEKKEGIVSSIKLFVFSDDRLNSWVREFYGKRSDIVHEGKDVDISLKEKGAVSYGSDFIITDFLIKIAIRNKLRLLRRYDFDRVTTDHLNYELKKWLKSNSCRFNKLISLKIDDLTRKSGSDDPEKSDTMRQLLLDSNSSDISPKIELFEQVVIKLKLLTIQFIDCLLDKEKENIPDHDQEKIKEIKNKLENCENKIEKICPIIEEIYDKFILRTEPLPANFDFEKDMSKLFDVFNNIYTTTRVPLDEIITAMEHVARLYTYKKFDV